MAPVWGPLWQFSGKFKSLADDLTMDVTTLSWSDGSEVNTTGTTRMPNASNVITSLMDLFM